MFLMEIYSFFHSGRKYTKVQSLLQYLNMNELWTDKNMALVGSHEPQWGCSQAFVDPGQRAAHPMHPMHPSDHLAAQMEIPPHAFYFNEQYADHYGECQVADSQSHI